VFASRAARSTARPRRAGRRGATRSRPSATFRTAGRGSTESADERRVDFDDALAVLLVELTLERAVVVDDTEVESIVDHICADTQAVRNVHQLVQDVEQLRLAALGMRDAEHPAPDLTQLLFRGRDVAGHLHVDDGVQRVVHRFLVRDLRVIVSGRGRWDLVWLLIDP